jgi:hypothetical protein
MSQLDPRRQLPGLLALIDGEEAEIIPRYNHLDSVLRSGLTCVGAFEVDGVRYADASFEQYAIIHRKPKALKALLDMRQTLKDPSEALAPRYANVKTDLFALAITLNADTCLDEVIKFAIAIGVTTNWVNPNKQTPLMVAAQFGKWGAVHKLVEHGASFFEPRNSRCAFINIMLDRPQDLDNIKRDFPTFVTDVRKAVLEWRWNPRTLVPTNGQEGQLIVDIWATGHSQDEKGRQGLQWLHGISPQTRIETVQVNPAAQPDISEASRTCDDERCELAGVELKQCPACKHWFCQDHFGRDDHACID